MNDLFESPTTLDDFSIEKIIGKGSFGSVFLVKRKKDQKLYALKSVFLEKLNKKEQENSVNEVRLLASVFHPNVISYKEAFFDEKNNSLNIIMEYANNGDLQTEISKKKKGSEKFNEEIIWLYSIQMIEGLKALHDKKIMHRDLKSANIFLSKNKLECKLGDMNVSKVIKEKVLRTQTGTPYYASPEVWRDEPYSYKSDLWSIGCVIYEMCALEPPFNGKDLDELFENICLGKIKRINNCYSDDLWNMILMLLQNDVEKRVNCEQFLESDLVKKKIIELKNNHDINYEGYLLEKNNNYKNENNVLLETIKFKNFNELKNNLPNFKNYESNANKRTGNENNNKYNSVSNYQSKHTSLNSLILNSSMKNYNINESYNKEKMSLKKRFHRNISFSKENRNQNYNNIILEENYFKKYKKKIINSKLPKNSSFKSNKHPSYISIPTNEKKRKKFKDFEKIIELDKIKQLLKIHRKKEKSIMKKERSKNDFNKKSFCNLLRNQTENNKKEISKLKIKENNNKNYIKRIKTAQKISIINKNNFSKLTRKKLIKSPTSITIQANKNKERQYYYNLDSKNKKRTIQTKNKLKNLYSKFFNEHKINHEKPNKRNLTTISNNQDISHINHIKNNNKNRNNNSKYNYYLNTGNYSSNDRRQKITKKRKIIYQNKILNRKEKSAFTNKNKKYLNEIFNDVSSNNNIIINDIGNNNSIKKIKNLFNFKEYSIVKSKGYKQKKDISRIKNDNDSDYFITNTNISKKDIRKKILNKKANDIPLHIGQKTLSSSKNINIKKLSIPFYHHTNKNKKCFISQKNILKTDNNYIKSKRERNMNIFESNNYILSNPNIFFQNSKPIFLDIKSNNNLKMIYKKRLKNMIKNKRINTTNSGYNLKREKIVHSQIFNNFYSINNYDSNLPVKVINFYN